MAMELLLRTSSVLSRLPPSQEMFLLLAVVVFLASTMLYIMSLIHQSRSKAINRAVAIVFLVMAYQRIKRRRQVRDRPVFSGAWDYHRTLHIQVRGIIALVATDGYYDVCGDDRQVYSRTRFLEEQFEDLVEDFTDAFIADMRQTHALVHFLCAFVILQHVSLCVGWSSCQTGSAPDAVHDSRLHEARKCTSVVAWNVPWIQHCQCVVCCLPVCERD